MPENSPFNKVGHLHCINDGLAAQHLTKIHACVRTDQAGRRQSDFLACLGLFYGLSPKKLNFRLLISSKKDII
jgi:hypothetical protein